MTKKESKSLSKTPREVARDGRRPVGRPTVFTPEILETILDKVANGATEHAVSQMDGMPSWSAWCLFKQWARENDKEFMGRLAQANEDWCNRMEALRHEIAEDQTRDILDVVETTISERHGTTVKRKKVSDNTAIQRDRLRVDVIDNTMKWKFPDKYGDKAQSVSNTNVAIAIAVNIIAKNEKTD